MSANEGTRSGLCRPPATVETPASQEIDADETLATLAEVAPLDWLVADHYALDEHWERRLRTACEHLMVIDDLANRTHACDLLLDQNLGRIESDYTSLVPRHCIRLIGPRFALLRPEFGQWRPLSLQRRESPRLQRLLITMGGVDKDNVTCKVLQVIAAAPLPATMAITVVLGFGAPWLDEVRALAATMTQPTEVLAGVHHMAQLMTESDLAIGAAGSTSWERCCLGLPCIQLVLAENQQEAAAALARQEAVWTLDQGTHFGSALCLLLEGLHKHPAQLSQRTKRASSICDGHGTKDVASTLFQWRTERRNFHG